VAARNLIARMHHARAHKDTQHNTPCQLVYIRAPTMHCSIVTDGIVTRLVTKRLEVGPAAPCTYPWLGQLKSMTPSHSFTLWELKPDVLEPVPTSPHPLNWYQKAKQAGKPTSYARHDLSTQVASATRTPPTFHLYGWIGRRSKERESGWCDS
jgi:hypothetical protein